MIVSTAFGSGATTGAATGAGAGSGLASSTGASAFGASATGAGSTTGVTSSTGATTSTGASSTTAGAAATAVPKSWSAAHFASLSSCFTAATTNASLCAGYVTVTTEPSKEYWQAAATGYAWTRAAAT